jgi:hypothetical protein
MPHVSLAEVQAWLETTRANLEQLDSQLEASIADQVLARVALSYDVASWDSLATTPKLVRKIIAMKYASWHYQRAYSEDADTTNEYALMLNAQAETLLEGVVNGSLELVDIGSQGDTTLSRPVYELPDTPAFTMGKVW